MRSPVHGPTRGLVAIIGMGCRFPGARNLVELWKLLMDGRDAVGMYPGNRFPQVDADLAEASGSVDNAAMAKGGFLDAIDEFDAAAFELSPREAMYLDPQHRLLLETAWDALENAGQPLQSPFTEKTAVFTGLWSSDFEHVLYGSGAELEFYAMTGSGSYGASGRISFAFGFEGPSVSVDAACSSSLVTVHLACQSLLSRECDMALAGGANAILSTDSTRMFTKAGMLARDGRCKFGSADADGFVRSEGAGMVVLKRLDDAIAAGDPIHAVIRGGAVSNDGRTSGTLMTPSRGGQRKTLHRAWKAAGVSGRDIRFFEAHGTGTSVGDPVEVGAIADALNDDGVGDRIAERCWVGSIKSNIGHTESAAGIAGLIKTVLALKHRLVPKSRLTGELNPKIDWDGSPLRLLTEPLDLSGEQGPVIAGVSSFALTGTNAHLVLQEYPEKETDAVTAQQLGAFLLPVSARSEAALDELLLKYETYSVAAGDLCDVAYTASTRRRHDAFRAAVVCGSFAELNEGAAALRAEASCLTSGAVSIGEGKRRIVFIAPGQGSQWAGMARDLLAEELVFRREMERCDAAIRVETGWSLIDELNGPEIVDALREIDVVQPALFSLSVSLAALWRSWGIVPDAVIGHSMGEVAAACLAGALSLEDAAAVICRRSRLMKTLRGAGAMLTVEMPEQAVELLMREIGGETSIAASNSPESTIVSGESEAITQLETILIEREVFCRRVRVDVASHSAQVDPILDDLRDALKKIKPRICALPFFSTVTGSYLGGPEMDAEYWAANLRKPVSYANGIEALARDGYNVFVELSPHPVLMPGTEATLKSAGKDTIAVSSTRRQKPERREMLASLGTLYRFGCNVAWESFYPLRGRCVALPEYPFQRERCWPEFEELKTVLRTRQAGVSKAHPLLGDRFESAMQPGIVTWEIVADTAALPFLLDHRVHGAVIFPAAAQVEVVLEALRSERPGRDFRLEDMRLELAMQIEEERAQEFQLGLRRTAGGYNFEIFGRRAGSGEAWTRHSSGSAELQETNVSTSRVDLLKTGRSGMLHMGKRRHYRIRTRAGIEYGPSFQLVEEAWCGQGESLLRVRQTNTSPSQRTGYVLHPALLDNCFQALQLAQPNGEGFLFDDTSLPVAIGCIKVYAAIPASGEIFCQARVTKADAALGVLRGDLTFTDVDGTVLGGVTGFEVQRGSASIEERASELLFEVAWEPYVLSPEKQAECEWIVLIFCDSAGPGETLGRMLADKVAGSGGFPRLVRRGKQSGIEDIQRVFAELDSRGEKPRDVVFLSSEGGGEEGHSESLADHTACASLIPELVQGISTGNSAAPPRLWMVTTRSVVIGGGELKPGLSGAAAWGVGAVAAVEHPELQATLVDLSTDAGSEEVAGLVRLLSTGPDDDRIAIRGTKMFVQRFVPAKVQQTAAGSSTQEKKLFRWAATYLVAGGLGGVGATVAEWMAANGAGSLVLISRREESEETRETLHRIEALGARAVHARIDIVDRAAVETLLAKVRAEMPPITGIMQAATVIDDDLLMKLSAARFDAVLGPKVTGTLNLYNATAGDNLDFMMLFSSIASVYPQPGHGSYAAANAFMDAFAGKARAVGRNVTSINWGGWEQIGLARETRTGRSISGYSQQGFLTMSGMRALSALKLAMQADLAQVVASPFDSEQAAEFFAGGRIPPVLRRLVTRAEDPAAQITKTSVQARLSASASRPEAVQILESYLVEELSRVLKLSSTRIGRETLFGSIGLDSLMTLEFVRRLKSALGAAVPTTTVFNHPTAALLAAEVARRMQLHSEAGNAVRNVAQEQRSMESTKLREARSALVADELSDEEALHALLQPAGRR